MPKNATENVYVTVTVPRKSWIHQKLTAELQNNTLSMGQLLLQRAGDWYRLQESGGSVPAMHTPMVEETVKRQSTGRRDTGILELHHQGSVTDTDLSGIEPD